MLVIPSTGFKLVVNELNAAGASIVVIMKGIDGELHIETPVASLSESLHKAIRSVLSFEHMSVGQQRYSPVPVSSGDEQIYVVVVAIRPNGRFAPYKDACGVQC
jgi:hypothetical protein